MKKLSTFFIGFIFLSTGISAQKIQRIDGSLLSPDSLDARIRFLITAANVSGVAVTVFNQNQPVFSRVYGLADVPAKKPLKPGSIVYGASLSKTVFAYIVMQLVDEKKIDLDKPLQTYLKKPLPDYEFKTDWRSYKDLKGDLRYEKITARMCLTHTSGFPNWRWIEPDQKLRIKFEPGSRYSYSGEGMKLLQFVIEQITGKDYETIARERVFIPLDMKNTSQLWQSRFDSIICYGHNAKGEHADLEKWDEPGAAGSMSTTPDDFNKFFTALLNKKGISESSFKAMTSMQVRIRSKRQFGPLALEDGPDNDSIRLGYGLGVGVLTSPFGPAFFKEGHDEGWGHYSIAYTGKKTAIIILTNNDNGESIFKDLLAYAIGDIYTPWRWENYVPYYERQ